jgi:hypothetical protein
MIDPASGYYGEPFTDETRPGRVALSSPAGAA